MNLDDAFHTRRIRSVMGLEPMRAKEYPFIYSIGDHYSVPDQREPIGRIEAITYLENFLGDHSETWFNLVVNGEIMERISGRAVGAVIFYDPGTKPRADQRSGS